MTPEGRRRPVDNDRHHRERGWDYLGRGIYHITLNVVDHYPLFGRLEGEGEEARVVLNAFGEQVLQRLLDTPRIYGERGYALKLLATQVMPDHIHIAIQALEPLPQSIGQVVRGFKSACTSIYKREYYCPNDGTRMQRGRSCPNDGTRMQRGENTMHFSRIFTRTGTIWEQIPEHYHERILHGDENQLNRMIQYIKDNPRRAAIKRANPDLFKIQEEIEHNGAQMRVMGNRFLLDWPMKEALSCSRTLTAEEIAVKRGECLEKAEEGTVFVCAAISEGEKQICRALREAEYPLVVLLAEGFPNEDNPHYKYYKPSGVYFEACAAGKLLLVEPAAEELERPEIEAKVYAKAGEIAHEAKRYRFLAMNGVAEKIAGKLSQ